MRPDTLTPVQFAFDAGRHEYVNLATGAIIPHITGMLQEAGLIDDRWYTEESCERGSVVHRLTAEYDLGSIERPQEVISKYKGYLDAHVALMKIIRPKWQHIEEPIVSSRYRFGGRPDRVGLCYGAVCIVEVKTGVKDRVHGIQTALQAILAAEESGMPEGAIPRYVEYLKPDGKFTLEHQTDLRDFDEAIRVIRRTT